MKKIVLISTAVCGLFVSVPSAVAQGTAFTYEGLLKLTADGSAVTGPYDFSFSLFAADSGGSPVTAPYAKAGIAVTDGLFITTIDFGGVFTGTRYWLEIASRPNGSTAAFETMSPRQELTPVPYAIFAETAGLANGVAANSVTASSLAANAVTTLSIADGTVVRSLNGLSDAVILTEGANVSFTTNGHKLQISANGGVTSGWALGGNRGTTPADFVGTTDPQPLELRVNGTRALWLQPTISDNGHSSIVNVVGGSQANFVAPGVYGATISGGGAGYYQATASPNSVLLSFGTVGGGMNNVAGGSFSTVSGGQNNVIIGDGGGGVISGGGNNTSSGGGTVGGGSNNKALNFAATAGGGEMNTSSGQHATVGGGFANTSSGQHSTIAGGNNNTNSAGSSVISGGQFNQVDVGAVNSVIGGGFNNHIYPSAISATIAGGSDNTAVGYGSFAAGINAHADHDGSFVWGDGSAGAYSSAPHRFDVLASGGVNFYTGGNELRLLGPWFVAQGLGGEQAYFGGDGASADVQIGSLNPSITAVTCWNAANNSYMHLSCSSLTIEGGADLAEPFPITDADHEIPQGAVVVIDEENPGHLKLSERPYDTRVAGVVSGAKGVNPGIQMQQQGLLEGGKNVSLTGRVYVQADTIGGPIKPGDLLTTSSIAGHAMRVADHARASGAILGKAMSTLNEGRGMVLVLVTLQ